MRLLITTVTLFTLSTPCFAIMRALNTAATGMAAQESHVDTISNNIANVNTTAYKKQRAEFESLHYQTIKEAGSRTGSDSIHNVGHQVGSGARVTGTSREFSQGVSQITNNPFDLMINGDGFFAVMGPNNQVFYTRDGSFNVNNQGILVNKQGYAVLPNLQIPPNTNTVNITEAGVVEAFIKNQLQPVNVGQITLYTFINNSGLKAIGGNNYIPSQASGAPMQNIAGQSSTGVVQQGALEASNVSIMTEMTGLIKAQRALEMNSKVMKVADEIMQTVNNIR